MLTIYKDVIMQPRSLGFFCFLLFLFITNIAYAAHLNHYSDYGLPIQLENAGQKAGSLSIRDDPFGYSDQYTDHESGLQYLRVRYYNPVIMRFTQMDTYPLLNRYAYATENPIMDDDPNGHNAVGTTNAKTPSFGETLSGNLAAASVYYGVMGIYDMVSSVLFPGLGAVSLFLIGVPVAATASTLAGLAQSGTMHQKVSAKQVGAAAVGGVLGGVFAGSMSMVETPILNDTAAGGLGFGHLATKAITGVSREVGLVTGGLLGNTMFGIPNNVPEKTTYLTGMIISLGIVNAIVVNTDSFEEAYQSEVLNKISAAASDETPSATEVSDLVARTKARINNIWEKNQFAISYNLGMFLPKTLFKAGYATATTEIFKQ